jgi:glucose/arabinose dehydrogenase
VFAAEPAEAVTLPPGFQQQIVISGLTMPTAVRLASDGRVFVAEKSGLIKVLDSLSDSTATVFADLRTQVHNFWDRGLLGLALDPEFPMDPWVYVLYTHDAAIGGTAPRWGSVGGTSDGCPTPPGPTDDGCVASGRLSRLQAAGDAMTGAEQVLIEDWCQQYPSHSIGTLAFGPDGALYVSGGEGASFNFVDYGQDGSPTNPCGDPPVPVGGAQTPPTAQGGALRSQDLRTSGDPVTLDGTILRVDPATGAGLPGNPHYSSPDPNARRIIAHGLRNPFKMTTRPGTSEVWLGDVGWATHEEIDRIVDPLSGAAAVNFGWPCYEGPGRQSGYDATNLQICENLYAAGSGAVQPPYFSYTHGAEVGTGDGCAPGSSSVAGLTFAPSTGGSYPTEYDSALFFADYSRRCLWVIPAGEDGVPDPAQRRVFVTGAAQPVDLQIGPDGEVYYVDLGGTIRRIRYTQAPQASATAEPTNGAAPLTVQFDGSGSSDPGGGPVSYAWDLDGDGAYQDSTSPTTTYTYVDPGTFTARLQVTDAEGASDTAPVTISVGNTPPTPVLDLPTPGRTWQVGDEIAFSGRADDAQDGELAPSSLSWSLILHHCPSTCHAHPVQTFEGTASGSFVGPDHEYPSHLELRLTAIDSHGLSAATSVQLDPQTVTVELHSDPPGLELVVGATSQPAPFTHTAIKGSALSLSAPSPQTLGSEYYRFQSWSDSGAESHNVVVGDSTIFTAVYEQVQGDPPPTANAGSDRVVASDAEFVLSGRGFDPDGQPLTYLWEQVDGPVAVLRDEDEAEATVEGLAGPATLTFRLTVTDSAGVSDSDEVVITVSQPK